VSRFSAQQVLAGERAERVRLGSVWKPQAIERGECVLEAGGDQGSSFPDIQVLGGSAEDPAEETARGVVPATATTRSNSGPILLRPAPSSRRS
jgi:hypothetical protein